jgi:NAD-dependent DNA ligase
MSPSQPESWYIFQSRLNHTNFIKRALLAGEKIPLRVQKQYPELFPDVGKVMKTKMSTLREVPSIKELEQQIKRASDAYYNGGKSLMSDIDFDALVDKLRDLKPDSAVLQKIGAPIKSRNKVQLPYHMGSLNKIKPDSTDSWLANNSGPYCVSDKLDGVSILLVWARGSLKAYTRGNGSVGQDITHLFNHLDLPPVKGSLAVRGELLMSKSRFAKYDFENPRNMVSGLVNRKDVGEGFEDVEFLAYELLSPRLSPSDSFTRLKELGFKVAPYKVFSNLDSSRLNTLLTSRRAKSKYDIDGLVVVCDKKQPLNKGGNPTWAVAFKSMAEDNVATTKVLEVEWNPSRHGLLKPRLRIEPVRLSGVTVNYTTGFNAKFIKDNGVGVGSMIKITRSGDVIPHILEVVKSTKVVLPKDCHWSGTDLILDVEHDTILIKSITNFFTRLGAEFISIGTITKLVDAGYDTIPLILKLTKQKLMKVDGFQDRSSERILTSIKSIQDVPLPRLMDATGIFGRLIGEKKLTALILSVEDVFTASAEDIAATPGWSMNSANQFLSGLPEFKKFLRATKLTYTMPVAKKKVRGKLSGRVFLFTGFRDESLTEFIESKGGEVVNSTSRVTHLVVKSEDSTSSKARWARDNDIPIITAQQVRRM